MNNTLMNGMQVLEHLARTGGSLGIAEIADALGMGRSMVHRLLQGWLELGYVIKNESSTYRASLKLWQIGLPIIHRLDVKAAASSVMAELLEHSRETVHLSVLDGNDVVYIDKLESPEPIRAYSVVGGRAPAHCVATGKAMLASRADAELKLLSRHLVQYSKNSITDPRQFEHEIQRIRQQGFAVNRGEWREEVWGLAASICDPAGTVVAAIGISGPASRLKPARIKELTPAVVESAARISSAMRDL